MRLLTELRALPFIRTAVLLAATLTLAGCEAAAVTAFGVGATTGVQQTLSGIAYRTFTAPEPRVQEAVMRALKHMDIKIASTGTDKSGNFVRAKAKDRDIEIDFEALSPNTTRMRAVAKDGWFYDSATAYEIVIQTERALRKA